MTMNNKIFDKIILSTSYFPPIEYFFAIENSKEVFIESKEIYQKQSYRTRCEILSCNGPLILNIPVLRDKESGHKLPISEIKIDYSTNWLSQHKRALEAAYKSSPFYEYYIDDINNILDKNFEYLFDLNNALNKLI